MADPDELLVDFAVRAGSDAVPGDVRHRAGLALLDAVTLAWDARAHPVVEAVRALGSPARKARPGWSRVWGSLDHLPVVDACFANAVAVHAHFQDDTDMVAWAHPGSLVPPVAVALAQAEDLPAEQVVRGVAAGYAALTWLGAEEQVSRAVVERGFRAGPVLGSVAAAVAAAVTLRLPAEQVRSSVGIAADCAGALLEPVGAGAQDWRLQNAGAAAGGVRAALLARAGVRGPTRPLTGDRALLAAFTGDPAVPSRWRSGPSLADIHRTWSKAFPTLGDNMAVAVAASQAHDAVSASDGSATIRTVTVGMNAHFAAYPGTAYRGPFDTIDQAVASTRFAVAALLVHGDLRYADYPELLRDQRVLDVVGRTTIEPDTSLDYVSGRVRVVLPDAVVERSAADAPRTIFFRDRAQARAAALRLLDSTPASAADRAVGRWLEWIDGAPAARPVDELLDAISAQLVDAP